MDLPCFYYAFGIDFAVVFKFPSVFSSVLPSVVFLFSNNA